MSQKRDDDERIKPLVERTLMLPPTQRDRVQEEGHDDSSQDPLFIATVDKNILHYKITGILYFANTRLKLLNNQVASMRCAHPFSYPPPIYGAILKSLE